MPLPSPPPPPHERSAPLAEESYHSTSHISSQIDSLERRLSPIVNSNALLNRVGNTPIRPTRLPPPRPSLGGTSPTPPRRPEGFQIPSSFPPATTNQASASMQAKYQEVLLNSGSFRINDQKMQVTIGDMTLGDLLGSGTCGQVFKMEHTATKTPFAVKIMPRTASEEENKRIIMDLHVIVKSYDFPYIVRCFGYFIRESEVWICMELMASCFDKVLKKTQRPVPECVLGKLTFSTVTALSYLKDTHGIIHRDVKPSNILIDVHGNIKLCDFGISGVLIESKAKSRNAGCVAYMSPERINPSDPAQFDYDIRADVWSLGISLIELATTVYPYPNCRNEFDVMSRIVQDDAPQLPADGTFSDDFRAFVDTCLLKDYQTRPKYAALMGKPFFLKSEADVVDVAGWYRELTAKSTTTN